MSPVMSPYVQRAWELLFMTLPPMNEVLIKLMDSSQWTCEVGIICLIEDIGKNDSLVAQTVKKKKKKKNLPAVQKTQVRSLRQEEPLE